MPGDVGRGGLGRFPHPDRPLSGFAIHGSEAPQVAGQAVNVDLCLWSQVARPGAGSGSKRCGQVCGVRCHGHLSIPFFAFPVRNRDKNDTKYAQIEHDILKHDPMTQLSDLGT